MDSPNASNNDSFPPEEDGKIKMVAAARQTRSKSNNHHKKKKKNKRASMTPAKRSAVVVTHSPSAKQKKKQRRQPTKIIKGASLLLPDDNNDKDGKMPTTVTASTRPSPPVTRSKSKNNNKTKDVNHDDLLEDNVNNGLCPDSAALIRKDYKFHKRRGVVTFKGRRVLQPIVIDPDSLTEKHILRDPSNGQCVMSVLPTQCVEDALKAEGWNSEMELAFLEDAKKAKESDPDPRGYSTNGLSTLPMAALGLHLQRFSRHKWENSIRAAHEKAPSFHGASWLALCLLGRILEGMYRTIVASSKDLELFEEWPTKEDIVHANNALWRMHGQDPPAMRFPDIFHQMASVGGDNPFTDFHYDDYNIGLLGKKFADHHICLTNNPDKAFVVHVLTENGQHWQPHAVMQRRYATTYFRAANQAHGTVHLETYLKMMMNMSSSSDNAHSTLCGAMGATSNNVKEKADGEEEQERSNDDDDVDRRRVFVSFYSRRSMFDVAFEMRNYAIAKKEPQYLIVYHKKGRGQPKRHFKTLEKHSDEVVRTVEERYGLRSPYRHAEKKNPSYFK